VIGHLLGKLLRVLSIAPYRRAFLRTRVAASAEHDDILSGLGVDTVVDIGANKGQFALCARRLFPQAQIFSFEPLPGPAAIFQNVFRDDPRTRLFNTAIAARAGAAAMHVSRREDSSSLLPIAQAQHENFPHTEEARQETVALARLADCIAAADITGTALLKLDVQGYELTALEGCAELLKLFRYVYVEASFIELYVGQALADEVVAHLQARGFGLMCVANLSKGTSQRPIQADFLFVRASPRARAQAQASGAD
jgi:FkbM family methyltransferase